MWNICRLIKAMDIMAILDRFITKAAIFDKEKQRHKRKPACPPLALDTTLL
jgi:hypothetical protein